MKEVLDKEDLIAMVKGIEPYYNVFDHSLIKNCGKYIGGFCDRWEWDLDKLEKLDNRDLYNLYSICKQSWK